jgi:uncharacterized protein
MHNFTPFSAIIGGLLIGLSSILLLYCNGRLAGISTICGKLMLLRKGGIAWRALFITGLIAGAALFYLWSGETPAARTEFPAWLLAAAGMLVGFGTAMANGCTSGHGVCGLARFSKRSLIATFSFLFAGIMTTYIVRHVFGIY